MGGDLGVGEVAAAVGDDAHGHGPNLQRRGGGDLRHRRCAGGASSSSTSTSFRLRRVLCQWWAHQTTRNSRAPNDSPRPAPDTAVDCTVWVVEARVIPALGGVLSI